jgi:hypothetical protein
MCSEPDFRLHLLGDQQNLEGEDCHDLGYDK